MTDAELIELHRLALKYAEMCESRAKQSGDPDDSLFFAKRDARRVVEHAWRETSLSGHGVFG
jgi:hypothetical protein